MAPHPHPLELGPPRVLEAVFERLVPFGFRHVVGDLAERYVGLSQYLKEATGVLARIVVWQIRNAFDPLRSALDLIVVLLAFAGARTSALIILPATVLTTLILRDAYGREVYGQDYRWEEEDTWERSGRVRLGIADGVAALSMAIFSQALLFLVAPGLVVDGALLARGSLLGVLGITAHRAVLAPRRGGIQVLRPVASVTKTPHRPNRSCFAHRRAQVLTVLWMLAGIVLLLANVEAMPPTAPAVDFVVGALFILGVGIGFPPDVNVLHGPRTTRVLPTLTHPDPAPSVLVVGRGALGRTARCLAAAALVFPIAVAAWQQVAAGVQDDGIDAWRWGAHGALVLLLMGAWEPIRRHHARAAALCGRESEPLRDARR